MHLTPKQAEKAFIPLMALSMSGLISLVLTAATLGIGLQLLAAWPRQWALGFMVALPAALLVAPLLRHGLARVTVVTPLSASSSHSPAGKPTP